jgi:hypothetical protein
MARVNEAIDVPSKQNAGQYVGIFNEHDRGGWKNWSCPGA